MKLIKKINPHQFFFTLAMFSWSLGQLQRIELSDQIVFYIHDLVIGSWLVFYLLVNYQKFFVFISKLWQKKKVFVSLLFFLILIGWSRELAHPEGLILPALYTLRLVAYLFFGVISYLSFKDNNISANFFRKVFTFSILTVLTLGLSQYFLFPDMRFLAVFGWDDHYYRLIYPFFDPAFTGQILVMLFVLWQSLKITPAKFKIIISILLSITIGLTFSRASYLSFVFVLCLLFFTMIKKTKSVKSLILYVATFLLSIILAVKPGGEGVNLSRTSSIQAKIINVSEETVDVRKMDYLVGNGLFVQNDGGVSTSIFKQFPTHNNVPDNYFVMIFSQLGLIGLALFFWGMMRLIRYLSMSNQYSLILFLSILLHGLFSATIIQPFVFILMVIALARGSIKSEI